MRDRNKFLSERRFLELFSIYFIFTDIPRLTDDRPEKELFSGLHSFQFPAFAQAEHKNSFDSEKVSSRSPPFVWRLHLFRGCVV